MRFIWLAVLLIASAYLATPSRADWAGDRLDAQVEGTNIVLGMDGRGFCSGSIISRKDRLIMTAEHCVADAFKTETEKRTDPKTGEVKEVVIESSGLMDVWQNKYVDYEIVSSSHYAAKVVTRDAKIDVAILQVVDTDWYPAMEAPFAPSTYVMRRGQTIYTVGNPAGILDASITKGIISNTQRKLQIGQHRTNYFQIDAAIIGGSSGGAVYNDEGQLIGIVSAGMTKSTINFAVPIKAARELLVKAGFKDFEAK